MNASLKELDGQRAVVTGSTSGIGQATALALARLGATVIVTGRDAGRGTRVVKEIEGDGGSARFVAADLSDPGGEWAQLHAAHTASGNPLRFRTGRVDIRRDEQWRSDMPAGHRRLVDQQRTEGGTIPNMPHGFRD